jgi:hypothetical protein
MPEKMIRIEIPADNDEMKLVLEIPKNQVIGSGRRFIETNLREQGTAEEAIILVHAAACMEMTRKKHE